MSVRILPGVRVYWTVYLSHRVRKPVFTERERKGERRSRVVIRRFSEKFTAQAI